MNNRLELTPEPVASTKNNVPHWKYSNLGCQLMVWELQMEIIDTWLKIMWESAKLQSLIA